VKSLIRVKNVFEIYRMITNRMRRQGEYCNEVSCVNNVHVKFETLYYEKTEFLFSFLHYGNFLLAGLSSRNFLAKQLQREGLER
jgi:hypothetical protein